MNQWMINLELQELTILSVILALVSLVIGYQSKFTGYFKEKKEVMISIKQYNFHVKREVIK